MYIEVYTPLFSMLRVIYTKTTYVGRHILIEFVQTPGASGRTLDRVLKPLLATNTTPLVNVSKLRGYICKHIDKYVCVCVYYACIYIFFMYVRYMIINEYIYMRRFCCETLYVVFVFTRSVIEGMYVWVGLGVYLCVCLCGGARGEVHTYVQTNRTLAI